MRLNQALDLSQKKAYVLGRSREQADYVVPDESVSRPQVPHPPQSLESSVGSAPWVVR